MSKYKFSTEVYKSGNSYVVTIPMHLIRENKIKPKKINHMTIDTQKEARK